MFFLFVCLFVYVGNFLFRSLCVCVDDGRVLSSVVRLDVDVLPDFLFTSQLRLDGSYDTLTIIYFISF